MNMDQRIEPMDLELQIESLRTQLHEAEELRHAVQHQAGGVAALPRLAHELGCLGALRDEGKRKHGVAVVLRHELIEQRLCLVVLTTGDIGKRGCELEARIVRLAAQRLPAFLKLRRTLLRPKGLRGAAPRVALKGEAWWAVTVSNCRPPGCKPGALPAELTAPPRMRDKTPARSLPSGNNKAEPAQKRDSASEKINRLRG